MKPTTPSVIAEDETPELQSSALRRSQRLRARRAARDSRDTGRESVRSTRRFNHRKAASHSGILTTGHDNVTANASKPTDADKATVDASKTGADASKATAGPTIDTNQATTDADNTTTDANKAITDASQIDQPREPGTFPFMELPTELRLNVYQHALVREEPVALQTKRGGHGENSKHESNFSSPAHSPGHLVITAHMHARGSSYTPTPSPPPRALKDPLLPVLLQLNRQIYKEARQVLYSENTFTLYLGTGINTLSSLHQRSRSLIKHVVLRIPSHYDILDGFADLVRLGLRYCWGLETFKIILPADLAEEGRLPNPTNSVYANAFHILRWLPRGCRVQLEGNVSEAMRRVVAEEGRLQAELDEVSAPKHKVTSLCFTNCGRHKHH